MNRSWYIWVTWTIFLNKQHSLSVSRVCSHKYVGSSSDGREVRKAISDCVTLWFGRSSSWSRSWTGRRQTCKPCRPNWKRWPIRTRTASNTSRCWRSPSARRSNVPTLCRQRWGFTDSHTHRHIHRIINTHKSNQTNNGISYDAMSLTSQAFVMTN